MTIELLLMAVAIAVLFVLNVVLFCFGVSDSRKRCRNAVDRLFDNARLNTDLKARARFKKTLKLLVKTEYVNKKTFSKAAFVFMGIAKETDDPLDKSYCLGWAGRCYEDYGDNTLAAVCYRAAVEISPSDTFASGRLGDWYWDNEPEEAEKHYERALEYDPVSSFTYYKLAKLYSICGDSQKAIDNYQTAFKVNNGYVAPMAEAAIESAKLGNKSKLLDFYCLSMANDVYEFEKLEEAISGCFT